MIEGMGKMTAGAILTNPILLVILAVGLVVLAVTGILVIIFAPNWVVAAALVVMGYVVIRYAPIPSPTLKFGIGFALFIAAILVFTNPSWFGLQVVA